MAGDAGAEGREGWQLVCVEQARGQRRVYMRRAAEAEGGRGGKGDWLKIDDHVSPQPHTHRYLPATQAAVRFGRHYEGASLLM